MAMVNAMAAMKRPCTSPLLFLQVDSPLLDFGDRQDVTYLPQDVNASRAFLRWDSACVNLPVNVRHLKPSQDGFTFACSSPSLPVRAAILGALALGYGAGTTS
jgi:hypothetical protein